MSSRTMLTRRYNIPIESISFEHISELKSNKESERELEKMIKILESGELGHFPQLLRHARDKLGQINRNHRLVRESPAPVDQLQTLEKTQAEQIRDELNHWVKEMKTRETQVEHEQLVLDEQSGSNDFNNIHIRPSFSTSQESGAKQSRIKSCDYAAWDRFDPDVEMKKMDVNVEREKTRLKRRQEEKEDEKQYYTLQEKVKYAEDSRLKGNDLFRAGKYQEAMKFYTNSIQLYPTATSYSNRAQVHIKLGNCKNAILDCDNAMSIDPYFNKAMYRKALALYNMKNYEESIVWFEKFLKEEPNNKSAHDYMNKINDIVPVKLLKNENKHKNDANKQTAPKIILISEDITRETAYVKENENNRKLPGQRNEWGFLKKQPIPRGQPEFMKRYETEKRKRYQDTSETHKTTTQKNRGLIEKSRFNTTSNATDTEDTKGKTIREIREKQNQFLEASEDYKPKAIVDIFGTSKNKKSEGIPSRIELSNKAKTTQRPKIEVLESVDFDHC